MAVEYRLKIDKWALDAECLHQVDMREQVSTDLVKAEARVLRAKAAADLMHSTLLRMAQNDPMMFNIIDARPTVDTFRAAVECDAEYQTATEVLRAALEDVANLKAIDKVLDERRRMLEHLVQLHGRDYWAAPRVSEVDASSLRDTTMAAAIGSRRRRQQEG